MVDIHTTELGNRHAAPSDIILQWTISFSPVSFELWLRSEEKTKTYSPNNVLFPWYCQSFKTRSFLMDAVVWSALSKQNIIGDAASPYLSSITQFKLLDKRKRQPLRCRARILCSIQLTLIVLLLSCCTPTMRKFTHPQMHARSDTKAISLSHTQPTSSLCVCVFPYTWVTTIQTWVSEIINSMQLSLKYKWNTHMGMLLYNAKHAFTVWNMFVNLI